MGSMRAERRSHNAMQAAEKGSKNLFTLLLRTRVTVPGGARTPHIYQICSGSCAPSSPVGRALVTDRKQVLKHLLFDKGHDRIRRNNEMVQQSNIKQRERGLKLFGQVEIGGTRLSVSRRVVMGNNQRHGIALQRLPRNLLRVDSRVRQRAVRRFFCADQTVTRVQIYAYKYFIGTRATQKLY